MTTTAIALRCESDDAGSAGAEGLGEALAAFGSMYEHGRGVPHNDEEAVRCYRAAAA